MDRQERLPSSLCSMSYLRLFECLRKWDGAGAPCCCGNWCGCYLHTCQPLWELLAKEDVCCNYTLAVTGALHLAVQRGTLAVMVEDTLRVLLSFPCYELVMSGSGHLEAESASAATDHSARDSKSKPLADLNRCYVMNWEFIVKGRNWQNWEITQLLHKPLGLDNIL